ncbi:MAG TPA: DedA family protein [Candidatus Paceibacterota bacterium]|nr:DedA family protein [Candidatus Paceibacterota bacterium]
MLHTLLPHLGLVHLVRAVGYPGLFAAVFLESGVFFGFFLPGSSMLFTAGLLATTGLFNPWVLMGLMALAAILGDNAGYWFGSYMGVSLFFWSDSRFFRHDYLERAKEFYEKHGILSIVLARFIPIVRTFAPIFAGVVKVRYSLFLMYNVLGGILWASGVTFLGYFLGRKVPFIASYITPIVILIIIASLVPLLWETRKSRDR